MTERERLIELLWGAIPSKKDAEDTADYLLANGVIVPPCKVGETLYDIHNEKVFGGKVIMVNMFEDCFTFAASGGRYFKDDEIGKTVFLTKEEAEQALKGAEGK